MGLTPERRKELRELARQHNEKQVAEKTEVKAVPGNFHVSSHDGRNTAGGSRRTCRYRYPIGSGGDFPFPRHRSGKAEGGSRGPFSACLPPHAGDAPARRSLVADRGRHNIGYLKDITPYGATFQPLDLKGYQKEKALLYVSLRDAYERLYRYESLRREANVPWREHLNTCYDEFVMRYGNTQRQAEREVSDDGCGRARHPFAGTDGKRKVRQGGHLRASCFLRGGEPCQRRLSRRALSASLNKYGTVNLDYMREITDSTAEDLLTALQGRIYYNPLVTGYEIKDRFIAGNVIEKAERIEAWMGDNPENERMPEVKQALEALKDAEPQRIAFEDLDFNFGNAGFRRVSMPPT